MANPVRLVSLMVLPLLVGCGESADHAPAAVMSVNELSNRCRVDALARSASDPPCNISFIELAARPEMFDGVNVRVPGYLSRRRGNDRHRYLFQNSGDDDASSWRPANGIVLEGDVSRVVCVWTDGRPNAEEGVPGVVVEGRFRRMAGYPDDHFLVGAITVARADGPGPLHPVANCEPHDSGNVGQSQ